MRRALAIGALVVAACGADDVPTRFTMTVDPEAPAYGRAPFPTDAVKEGARLGTIAGLETLVGRRADVVTAQLGGLDGFGLRPLIEFFVDGDLDPAQLPARTSTLDAVAAMVDVDPVSPERGRVIALDWRYDPERRVLAGSPASGELLREGTRYAAFVTCALRDARGERVEPAAALSALGGASPPRWQTTAEAYHALSATLDERIAALAVFTTQRATAPLLAARAALDAEPVPALAFERPALIFAGATALDRILGQATRATDGPRAGLERWGNDNPTGLAHDHVGVIATGSLTTVRFRGDPTGTGGADDETFALDPRTGAPRVVAREQIPVTLIVPAAPPPATGYPLVIYGHGLGAGRDQMLSFAEPLTRQGFALIGIDMFGHGSRFDPVDEVANLSGQLLAFTGEPATPDGFGDRTGLATQFEFFEGFANVGAVRDSIRQSALDLSQLTRAVRHGTLDLSALAGPGGVPVLDPSRLAYLGESFGTVVGTLFAATEPGVDLFVLDVPGGGILDKLLPTSAEIGALALPLIETLYNPLQPLDRWSPLIGLMQAVIDGGDPLTYAPHVLRDRFAIAGRALGPRSVIAIEVVGDQVLSNVGTDALAQGLGLDVLAPHLDVPEGLGSVASPAAGNLDGQTAVLVQYAPATHGANWSSEHGVIRYLPAFPAEGDDRFPRLPAPITIPNPIYETLEQVLEILVTHQAGEPPRVRMTRPPVRDFDADGVPDDQDAAPLDPSRR